MSRLPQAGESSGAAAAGKPKRSFRLVILAILSGLATVALAASVALWFSRRGPVSEGALEMARAGVTRNVDWQPVARDLDGLPMVLVPAGRFRMGSTEAQIAIAIDSCERFFGRGKCQVDFAASETPAHEVRFEHPFWIGQTEVTNRLYGSSSSTDMIAMYRGPSWPRETVTWEQAAQFCLAHGGRLPSEAEWEYSARGPDGPIYPWGDEFDLEVVISGRLSPNNVGSIPEGVSWVGAFDMSGGIAEWVADWYGPYGPEARTDPPGPPEGERRVVRGGSWFSFAAFFLRAAQREGIAPDTANSTIGFRCAHDLE